MVPQAQEEGSTTVDLVYTSCMCELKLKECINLNILRNTRYRTQVAVYLHLKPIMTEYIVIRCRPFTDGETAANYLACRLFRV